MDTEKTLIHKDVTMHPPINVLINFNDFKKKNTKHKTRRPP